MHIHRCSGHEADAGGQSISMGRAPWLVFGRHNGRNIVNLLQRATQLDDEA
jgi:hypothetical protein